MNLYDVSNEKGEMTDRQAVKQRLRDASNGVDLSQFMEALDAFRTVDGSVQATHFCANQIKRFQNRTHALPLRIAILSSFTLELIEPALRVSEFCAGRDLIFQNFAYDQWASTLSIPGELDEFEADVVVLVLHLEDVAPLLASEHLAVDQNALHDEQSQLLGLIQSAVESFRMRQSTPVVLSTFIVRERGVERYFDRRVENGRVGRISRLNDQLGHIARSVPNIFVFDYAEIVSDYGRLNWFDRFAHYYTHASISAQGMIRLANEISSYFSAMFDKRHKVLAVDLDNTLWHGIIGEDGPDGVITSGGWPGNAYINFQTFLKNLRASGILLVLLSKNNESDVIEGFEMNQNMPLALSDFVAKKINWNDKATNLSAVAEELSLAPDSFVFMDDNRLEIALMQEQLPEVESIHAIGPPSEFPNLVLSGGRFFTLGLTEEDRVRADSYAAQEARNTQQSRSFDLKSFLGDLGLCMEYRAPKKTETERVVQLFARTNQFNLTTIRYAHSDILSLIDDSDTNIKIIRLEDRFGDYGLVGVVVIRKTYDGLCQEIDSFLMSCRVLGRQVEDGILAKIENDARTTGAKQLIGKYSETRKNKVVASFYTERGFELGAESGTYLRDLIETEPMHMPAWIALKHED